MSTHTQDGTGAPAPAPFTRGPMTDLFGPAPSGTNQVPPQPSAPAQETVSARRSTRAMWINAVLSLFIVVGVGLVALIVLIVQTSKAVRWARYNRQSVGRYVAPLVSVIVVYVIGVALILVIGLTVGVNPSAPTQSAPKVASAPKAPAVKAPVDTSNPAYVFDHRLPATGDLAVLSDAKAQPTPIAVAIEAARLKAFRTHDGALLASLYQSANTPGYQADLKFMGQPYAYSVSATTDVVGNAGDQGYLSGFSNYVYKLDSSGTSLVKVSVTHTYQFDSKLNRWVITDAHQL